MSKMPTEFTAFAPDDTEFKVRFDFDAGEDQWFDARAGVGSPGYPASVEITEVNFGTGWESPDVYPSLNIAALEQQAMDIVQQHIEAEAALRCEAEYNAWNERVYE